MAPRRRVRRGLWALLVGITLGISAVASAQDISVVAQVTSPIEGAVLFGPVNITGSAFDPTAFDRYALEYDLASEPGDQWFPVQEQVAQQVQNGVLGTWDTTRVPDGVYRLRLVVYRDDGSFAEAVVPNLQVRNRPPTAVPTVGPAGVAPGAALPTPGPSPTSPIVQPPSSNPQPEPAGAVAESDPAEDEAQPSLLQNDPDSTRVDLDRVQRAFCTGGVAVLVVFIVALIARGVRCFAAGDPGRAGSSDRY